MPHQASRSGSRRAIRSHSGPFNPCRTPTSPYRLIAILPSRSLPACEDRDCHAVDSAVGALGYAGIMIRPSELPVGMGAMLGSRATGIAASASQLSEGRARPPRCRWHSGGRRSARYTGPSSTGWCGCSARQGISNLAAASGFAANVHGSAQHGTGISKPHVPACATASCGYRCSKLRSHWQASPTCGYRPC